MGLTQGQLALLLDVHRLSVVRWEAGDHKIPMMLKLALKELERNLKGAVESEHLTEKPRSSSSANSLHIE
jgi:DNA-binding XRE family transcriptional regulator